MTKQVVRVPYVYGGHLYVSAEDLASTRVLLPLYTRDGRVWTDTKAGMRASRNHEATRLHRENIGEPVND